jgi:RimJ/RimL family protein N-acetyltransferase
VDRVATARLTLRRPRPDDVDAVFRIHGDPRTNAHNPDGPQRDVREAEAMLAFFLDHWDEHGFGYWAVEDATGRVIGFGGLMRLRQRDGAEVLNLSYRFEPDAWGRGYATEVARAAVALAETLGADLPVIARTRQANEPAKRVALRAGLERRADLDRDGFAYFALGYPRSKSRSRS